MTWFINDPNILATLQTITQLAGPNFALPYDDSSQPSDGSKLMSDNLLQIQSPGGIKISPSGDPTKTNHMGSAISSLLTVFSPFVYAYSLILPILGVIRGIIEVLCALKNPFAVIKAIIRLFKKWIPAFLSLFPPTAGLLLILGVIKIILAIVLFILTVVVPIYQLIKRNLQILTNATNEQQKAACKEKLKTLIVELLKQTGLLNVVKPILEIVMAILRLFSGKPCKKKKSKGKADLTKVVLSVDVDDADDTCCDDNVCPPVFKSPPKGRATIVPTSFSDAPPYFAWKISTITGNSGLSQISPYIQSFQQQLNSQLDEPVSEAQTAGSSGNSASFNVKITGRRGQQTATMPIVKIKGNDITVINPSLFTMIGAVQYEIIPNWEVLIAYDVVGLACHPDVAAARDSIEYPDTPGIDIVPELDNIGFDKFVSDLNALIDSTNKVVLGEPPFDIDGIQNDMVNLLINFINNLKNIMNRTLSKITSPLNSELDVDKNLVKAGETDKAIISVIPRDATGALIAQQLPDGVSVDVKLFTDFGTISNQVLNSSTGVVTADIVSLFSGVATITAKINNEYIVEFSNDSKITREVSVRFISDAVLPKRRLVSKQSAGDIAHGTSGGSQREPGGK